MFTKNLTFTTGEQVSHLFSGNNIDSKIDDVKIVNMKFIRQTGSSYPALK